MWRVCRNICSEGQAPILDKDVVGPLWAGIPELEEWIQQVLCLQHAELDRQRHCAHIYHTHILCGVLDPHTDCLEYDFSTILCVWRIKMHKLFLFYFFQKINGFCLENCACTQAAQNRGLNQTAKVEEDRRWDKGWKESSFLRGTQRQKHNLKKTLWKT